MKRNFDYTFINSDDYHEAVQSIAKFVNDGWALHTFQISGWFKSKFYAVMERPALQEMIDFSAPMPEETKGGMRVK